MIEKLIVIDYLPLKKKGVSRISLHTKSLFNIIFGRNGYGKTSLLRLMNPFPPDNGDFDTNGYKEIHYKINNNLFQLISKTGKKSDHQFILNGKNLNEGGTLLVQRDLVRSYFNITPEICNFLTGIDRSDLFSTLAPQRRKSILMELNPNDTKYGLKIFEKAKTALNQTKGALKHQRQRLAIEVKRDNDFKSMSQEQLQEEISKLEDVIKNSLLLHGSLQHVKDHDVKSHVDKLNSIATKLFGNIDKTIQVPSYYIERMERTQLLINRNKTYENGLQALLHDAAEKINNFNIPEGMSLQGYEEKINECEENITFLNKQKQEHEEIIGRESFFNTGEWKEDGFKRSISDFISYVELVENTEDTELTSQSYINSQLLYKNYCNEIVSIEKERDNLTHQLKHYENAEDVTCPDCNKQFKVGFSKVDPKKLKEAIFNLGIKLEKVTAEANKLKDVLDRNEGWFETMGSLMRYVKHSPVYRYHFDIVKHYDVGKVTQNTLLNILKIMKEWYEVDRLVEGVISQQTTLKAQYNLMSNSDLKSLTENFDSYSLNLGESQRETRRLNNLYLYYQNCLDTIKEDHILRDTFNVYFDQLMEMMLDKGKYLLKQRVKEVLSLVNPQKDKLLADFIRAQSMSSVIASIEENIAELEKREKHLKLIVDGLSPVSGYIAELMVDFLNSLCANVNAAIEPVWTDPLRVHSCALAGDDEDLDLDYKFPVTSGGTGSPNDDVKKCSGGEREIIDFMIRRVGLRYKTESAGIPLIMDEIGIAFDELHRANFANYINEQLRLDLLPQTFMISHYLHQYDGFNRNEINAIALNTKGITIPLDVNNNTTIN